MRTGPSGARRYYTNSVAAGDAHKVSTDIRPMLSPFLQGQNVPNFGPNFNPNRLRTAVFELRRFIGNQKQTWQGIL